MKYYQLNDDLFWLGTLDPDLRVFDIIMHTEFGTTYNSYLMKGSEKNAIFETAKLKCWDAYKESLEALADIKDIDYIIMNHTEPDHSGVIEKLIDINPKIKIVGTGGAISFLKNILNREFNGIAVKAGDTLSLGNKTLHFKPLPNLHWPDTMYTYVEEDQLLFTCDSFGAHYCHDGVVRSTVVNEEDYLSAAKYYFDNIIGPFKNPFMEAALEWIKDKPLKMICTGHGPVLDSHIEDIIELNRKWCQVPEKGPNKLVVIPYVSAYGYTRQLAEKIRDGILDSGPVDVKLYDIIECGPDEAQAEIAVADGVLFGTPTMVGEALAPIWHLTLSMFAATHKGKLASAFGSYGWSGEGVPHILERLKQLKLKVIDGFKISFKPSDNELMDAFDYGYNFGCLLQNKANDRSQASGKQKMYKCMVCGAVFDMSLDICPVCAVGKEHFVEVDAEEESFKRNTDEKYLVLGGGAAAYNAARAIRERNETCSIVMISEEPELPYTRTMLTKAMLADYTSNQLAISGQAWYDEQRITILNNKQVVSIDTANKEVVCQDIKMTYDKLIYALGSKCFIPPFAGVDQDHVISIRKIADVEKIKAMLGTVNDAVVIGGGVLGLETAWQLKKAQIANVTVLETADRVLPRQLDAGASEMLAEIIRQKGVNFVTGAITKEITADAVVLEDGTSVAAQLVIVSTGVRANIQIAEAAGIKVHNFIEVDEHMQTNIPDIYACGDCAAYQGVSYALWAQAVEMGKTAGANAAGEGYVYEAVDAPVTFLGLDTRLFVIGDTNHNPELKYRTVEMKDEQRMTYEKLFFSKNRLVGVILLGDITKATEWSKREKEHATYQDVIGGQIH